MKILLLIITAFTSLCSCAQKYDIVYLNAKDSTADYYLTVMPEDALPGAVMVLMPGAFQTPENVLQQTDLPQYAASRGILVVVPLLQKGVEAFGIDSISQQSLRAQVRDVMSRYRMQGKDLYIGGFSLGGSTAVKYAECAAIYDPLLKPKAVFAIDPPLDFERYYNAAKRIVRLSAGGPVNQEIIYMMGKIEKEMKGTPQTAPENFSKLSPYSGSDDQQTAVKTLVYMPVMLITEPDIEWWLNERGYDYSFMNSLDQAAMINELRRLGNKNAVLVTTQGKGYRNPGHKRHPHSFSIVDNGQLLDWLQSQKK